MARSIVLAALLLSGCAALFPGKPRPPFAFGDKGELVDFHYGWPAEASAIPALESRFRAALDKSWKQELAAAVADRNAATAAGRKYEGHQFRFDWNTAGQTRRLLSLEGMASSFPANRHDSHRSDGLIWDRGSRTAVAPAALFANTSQFAAIVRPQFCAALDRERAKRRAVAEPHPRGRVCPPFEEVTIVPSDYNRNGRFESLRMTADPNVAGSYPEGFYQVILPVSATFFGALKPAYRSSFEIAQPQ